MSPPDTTAVPAGPRTRPRSAWRATEPLRWAVGLGALCGLVAGGLGSRVVMGVIAAADPSTDGTLTDAEATSRRAAPSPCWRSASSRAPWPGRSTWG